MSRAGFSSVRQVQEVNAYLKKPENPSKYQRLDLNDRINIQQGLNKNLSVSKIAEELGKSVSTIKREIERNRDFVASSGNDCLNKNECHERNACKKECNHKLCKHCKSVQCYLEDNCSNYIKSYCDRLSNHSPHVCNGCLKNQSCTFEKYIYKAAVANTKAENNKKEKVAGFRSSSEEISAIDELISPKIQNGLSPEVALSSVRDIVGISTTTLYRMLNAGVLTARNIDLPEKVGRRKNRRKTKTKNKDAQTKLMLEKQGHTYDDYLNFIDEHNDIMVVEMDCVEGRKTDSEAILSLHWKEFHMQLYFIMPVHDSANVVKQLDIIEQAIGLELFRECLPLILTDNGEEFTDINGMERSCTIPGEKRTAIYFCEPNRSDQKGSCERNHRLLRRIIPKRTSWDDSRNKSIHGLRQPQLTLATNHINSYPRPEMNYIRPYDMAMKVLPEDFFILLGLELIDIRNVILKPELIY